MDAAVRNLAQKYFDDRHLLGPIAAPTTMSKEYYDLLFETENRIIRELNREAQLFVGRRGSGKTSFLRSVQFVDPESLVVDITSVDAFSLVTNAIENLRIEKKVIFVEHVARVWASIYWLGILWQIGKTESSTNRSNVGNALQMLGFARRSATYEVVMKVLAALDLKLSLVGAVE